MGTGMDTVSASDAFGVIGCAKNIHIHLADPGASTTGGAFV